MRAALKGLQTGHYASIRCAARANKVTPKTLGQQRKGLPTKAEDEAKRKLLTDKEEELLLNG
jgi:hypothetical protein